MKGTLVLRFQGTKEEETEILKNIYEIYLKYLQHEISEDDYINLLKASEIQRLSGGEVEYVSARALDRACVRFSNLYYKKVLGKNDSWLANLRKKNNEYKKKYDPKKVALLKKIYETYVAYVNGDISEEQYHQKIVDTDFSVLSNHDYDDFASRKRSYSVFARKYAIDYLNMDPSEFDDIKSKMIPKAELELYDKRAKPILKEIYDCYWDYLNKKLEENEFYQKIRELGIEKFSVAGSVDDGRQMGVLLGRCVNYYSRSILKIDAETFDKMRNRSPLYKEKNRQDRRKVYSEEAVEMMKLIHETYFHYLNMDIDYSEYRKFLDQLDFSVITDYSSYRNHNKFSSTVYARVYATKFLGMTEEEFKEKKYNSKLYCESFDLYNRYVHLECSYDELEDFRKKTGVNVNVYAREYAECHHMDEEYAELVEARKKNQDVLIYNSSKKSMYYETIEKLELDFDLIDFAYLVLYDHLNLYSLKDRCFDYLIVKYMGGLSSEQFDEKLALLRGRLELVQEYVKNVKSEKRKEEVAAARKERREALRSYAMDIVQEFIDTKGAKLYQFAREKDLSVYWFSQLVDIVEETDPKMYASFRIKTKANSAHSYAIIVQKIFNVLNCIKYGRTNPYTNRTTKFTLFDYLDIVPRSYSNYSDFMKLAQDVLNADDLGLLRGFMRKNSMPSFSEDNTDVIMKSKVTFQGEIVSNDVKYLVLDYMRKHKIPTTLFLFQSGLKKYFNDELYMEEYVDSEEEKSEIHKKK